MMAGDIPIAEIRPELSFFFEDTTNHTIQPYNSHVIQRNTTTPYNQPSYNQYHAKTSNPVIRCHTIRPEFTSWRNSTLGQ